MKRRILILLRFGIAFLFTVDLGISLYIQRINVYPNGNHSHYSDYQGPIVTQIIWPFLETVSYFVLDSPELITAIATAFIAAYTIILAKATKALTILAEQQEKTAKTHERAYIYGGGRMDSQNVAACSLKLFTILKQTTSLTSNE